MASVLILPWQLRQRLLGFMDVANLVLAFVDAMACAAADPGFENAGSLSIPDTAAS